MWDPLRNHVTEWEDFKICLLLCLFTFIFVRVEIISVIHQGISLQNQSKMEIFARDWSEICSGVNVVQN